MLSDVDLTTEPITITVRDEIAKQGKGKVTFVSDEAGEYLGTLEVSQILTEKRKLEGEQRLLSYKDDEHKEEE